MSTTDRRRFSLIGHPVRHSVSPAMCNAAFAAMGLPCAYTAIDVPNPRSITRITEDLRSGALAGCNVTLPYKRVVLQHVDIRHSTAETASAANVLTVVGGQIVAHNTDAIALAEDIAELTGDRPRHRAAIIGSGGAGLAALIACQKLGFKVISMTSRSWLDSQVMFDAPSSKRARALGALTTPWPHAAGASRGRLSQVLRMQWFELTSGSDCVIQATSAGMLGGDPGADVADIVPWQRLPAHALAYDVVYNPPFTPFLARAAKHNLATASGLGMLVRQGARSIELWTGRAPPLDKMREAALQALSAPYGGR